MRWLWLGLVGAFFFACGGAPKKKSSDDDDGSGGATTTVTTASVTSGSGGGVTAACTQACTDLYDCGLELEGADQLCPGFSGVVAEKVGFVGDSNSGCVASCEQLTALISLIDPTDCPGTIANISAANASFDDVCQNGFAQGTGGFGGRP